MPRRRRKNKYKSYNNKALTPAEAAFVDSVKAANDHDATLLNPKGTIVTSQDIAYTDSRIQFTYFHHNRDLIIRTKGARIYENMLSDDQVHACLRVRKHAIISNGYRIEGEDEELNEFTEFAIENMSGTFTEKLKTVLTAIEQGFSVSEKKFLVNEKKDFNRKWIVKDIKGKHPDGIDFKTDPYGNLLSVVQNSTKELPTEKFIIYPYNSTYDNKYGTSDLRAAYRPWFSKDITIKFLNVYNERFGMPIVIGKIPPNFANLKPEIDTILRNIQAKTSITLPSTEIMIEFLEAGRSSSSNSFIDAMAYFDSAISRACGVPSNLGFSPQGNKGSLAQAQVQFKAFIDWVVTPDQVFLADIINEQYIRQLIDINFGNDRDVPKLVFNPLTSLQQDTIAKVWSEAVQRGTVQQTLDDENVFRNQLNFPERLEGDEVLEPPKEDPKADNLDEEDLKKNVKLQLNSDFQSTAISRSRSINFARMGQRFDRSEAKYIKLFEPILIKQRDNIKKDVNKLSAKNKLTERVVNTLILTNTADTRRVYGSLYEEGFISGQKEALSLIPAKYKKDFSGKIKLQVKIANDKPTKAIKRLKDKRFWLTDTQDDQVLKEVKQSLLKHLRQGVSLPETMNEIDDIFSQYIHDVSNLEKLTSGFQLETIVRTNITDAFAMGMFNTYRQPELSKFIPGIELSAILDSRTTAICAHLHGKQFKNSDPEIDRFMPPNHFRCRTIPLPIFIEEMFTPISKRDVEIGRDLIPDSFY